MERGEEGEEKREGEEVAVKEILMPMGAVGCVCELGVEAHYRRQELGESKDYETGYEGVVYGRRRGSFALEIHLLRIGTLGDGMNKAFSNILPLIGHLPLQP